MSALLPEASAHAHLDRLYREHHGWLRGWLRQRLSNSADAADLAQDTFVRVLLARSAASLREPRHYLATVARGLVIDLYRRRSLEQAYLDALAARPECYEPSAETRAQILDSLLAIDRLHDSQASQADRDAWQAWLGADPRHGEAWSRLDALRERLGSAPAGIAAQALEGARQDRRAALRSLAVLLGVGLAGWQGYRLSPASVDLATGVGERRRVMLADGSRLELDTDTRVNLNFSAGQRQLHLLRGSLLLDSADDVRLLSVRTEEGLVRTRGGRFGVRQEDGRTRLLVEQGQVEVLAGAGLWLQAGQGLDFDRQGRGLPYAAPEDASAWTRGMLVAVDWRLDALLAELSRYHRGYLGCSDEVAGLRLSGAFVLDDLPAVIGLLEASLPVRSRGLGRYWVRLDARPA